MRTIDFLIVQSACSFSGVCMGRTSLKEQCQREADEPALVEKLRHLMEDEGQS